MEFRNNLNTSKVLPSWIIPFDVLCIIMDIVAVITGLMFVSMIIIDKLYNTVAMVLFTNTCIAQLLFSISVCGINILTLYDDIQKHYSYDWPCMPIGYLSYMAVGIQYYSYLLQAMYRYSLMIYPTRLLCQSLKFQTLLIIITWVFWLIYPTMLIYTEQIVYIPDAKVCQMPPKFSLLKIFTVFLTYFTPMVTVTIIYIQMVHCVREMGKRVTPANSLSHAKRELELVRRIVLLLFSLLTLGIPYMIFFIMSFFNTTPKYYFRIIWVFVSATLVLIMLALFQVTEKLKKSIMKRIPFLRENTIQPIP